LPSFRGLRNIDELTNYWYNKSEDMVKSGFSTADAGAYNPLYGAIAWINFNLEANVVSVLPKFVWDYSGARIMTAKGNSMSDAGSSNNTSKGGTVQGGLIAGAIKPTIEELLWIPKTLQYVFEVSELHEYLVEQSRDDAYGSLAQQRVYAADQVKEMWNQMLTLKSSDLADTAADNLSRLDLESLDRIISSKAEYDANNVTTESYNPWKDTADINRNSATTWDSTVVSPTGNLNTADVLTDAVIRNTMARLRIAGGRDPTVMIGGQDTYSEIQSIYMNAYRIQNTADLRSEFDVTANGIKTFTGTGVGLHISTVYNTPFIPTKDSPVGLGEVGDLYILNTAPDKNAPLKPMLGLQVLKPILYYEASKRQQGYPFINEAFKDRALYESMMENTCRNFKAQGKIININSGI